MLSINPAQAVSYRSILGRLGAVENLVRKLIPKIRGLYYGVVLFAKLCPSCGRPELVMPQDGWCHCEACGHEFDPTVRFQRCLSCGGQLERRVYHYACAKCRRVTKSAYCFDGKVFDAEYFREMMRESRERKRKKREQLKRMLAETRSQPLGVLEEPRLGNVPGLADALQGFVDTPVTLAAFETVVREPLDLDAYCAHIRELVTGCTVHFDGIGRLIEDHRLDRVYRFIAVIFMAHAGEIVLLQDTPKAEIIVAERG